MIHAILTGDIIKSSNLIEDERKEIIETLKNINHIDKNIDLKIEIFRGDGFQLEVKEPEKSLKVSILLRALLRGKFYFKFKKNEYDARIAIGIGKREKSLWKHLAEEDGEAFRYSGRLLDELKRKDNKIAIKTKNEYLDEDFEIILSFLEIVITNWKPLQADVIFFKILGYTEQIIAEKLQISQPAVNQAGKGANWWAVEKLLNYFEKNIKQKIQ